MFNVAQSQTTLVGIVVVYATLGAGLCTDYAVLAVVALADDDMPTNLPAPTYTGPVQGNASIVIDAPLEKVWAAVIDFPSYPQWYVLRCIFEDRGWRLTVNVSADRNPFV